MISRLLQDDSPFEEVDTKDEFVQNCGGVVYSGMDLREIF